MKPSGVAMMVLALLFTPCSAQARDRDHDRLPDSWEKRFRISTKARSGAQDRDRDGLTNRGEYLARTSPRRADSDRDRIPDDDEDRDRDRVDNGNEEDQGTRPRDRDSDNDGILDGREDRDRDGLTNRDEDRTGNHPRDRDTDNDGILDGHERAGAVASFRGGVLTIDLASGAFANGAVTETTEIDCRTEDEAELGRGPHRRRSVRASQPEDVEDVLDGDEPDGDDDSGTDPGDGNDRDEGPACGAAQLAPGTPVHAAAARLTPAGLVFTEIELIR